MQLEFTHLEMENFKAFVGTHELPLTEFGPGLHFVRGRNDVLPQLGSNGAGKSSVWDALCWCLYGKTPGGLRNPDVRPWAGGTTRVSVTLMRGDVAHHVVRIGSTNGLTLDGLAAGQEQVTAAVGLTFEAFTNTVLLGQGQPLFFDLGPKAKMDLFSDVLDLRRWEARAATASDRAAELGAQANLLEGVLVGIDTSKEEIKGLLAAAKADYLAWDRDRRARGKADDQERAVVRQRLEAVTDTLDIADVAMDGALTEMKALQAEHRELQNVMLEVQSRYQAKRRVRADELKRLTEELENLSGGTCPTCGQSLTGEELRAHRVKLKTRIAELGLPMKKPTKLTKIEDKLVLLSDAHEKFRMDAAEAEHIVRTSTTTAAGLKAKLQQLDRIASELADATNPHEATLRDARGRLGKLVAERREARAELVKVTRRLERTRFWIRGFKEVRLYVIEEVLTELGVATNAALASVGLEGWEVTYAVEKETKSGGVQRGLNVSVTSPSGVPARWEAWSGGEGQRLRLVGALALSEVLLSYAGLQANLEVLDEPTQHLSAEGVRDLCDHLSARARSTGKATFYVDHQSVESARFASVLTVVKDRDGARLEREAAEA